MGDGGANAKLVPRLCHIVRWSDFNGYGFNLHAEKGKAGQYIGKVDEGSPAEAAGLKQGDRIVEVNGVNIGVENHQQVVARIKAGGDETRLLVVDSETDQLYKDEKKVIKGDLPEVSVRSAARDGQDAEPAAVHSDANGDAVIPGTMPSNDNEQDERYKPRLCNLCKWPDFDGYGFNLHAEKEKPGQFIGSVDPNSPAETGGLREGDRIIEVNGENIESYIHSTVIAKIKSRGDETQMLVVDKATDSYYKGRGQTVSSSMSNVVVFTTPRRQPDVEETTQAATLVVTNTEPEAGADDNVDEGDDDRLVASNNGTDLPEPNVSLSDEETERVEAEVSQPVESAPVPDETVNGTGDEDEEVQAVAVDQVAAAVDAIAVAEDDQQEPEDQEPDFSAYEQVEVPPPRFDEQDAAPATVEVEDDGKVSETAEEPVTEVTKDEELKEVDVVEEKKDAIEENGVTNDTSDESTKDEGGKNITAITVTKVDLAVKADGAEKNDEEVKVETEEPAEKKEEEPAQEKTEDEPPAETPPTEDATDKVEVVVSTVVSTTQNAPDVAPQNDTQQSDEPIATAPEVTEKPQPDVIPTQANHGRTNGINGGIEDRMPEPEPTPAPVPEPEPVRAAPAPEPEPAVIRSTTSKAVDDLNLNLSAAEMKERLKSRRKQDPRMQKQSFEQKHQLFEKMGEK